MVVRIVSSTETIGYLTETIDSKPEPIVSPFEPGVSVPNTIVSKAETIDSFTDAVIFGLDPIDSQADAPVIMAETIAFALKVSWRRYSGEPRRREPFRPLLTRSGAQCKASDSSATRSW